jgi:hypothetical protein
MLQTVTLMRPWGFVEGVDAERVDAALDRVASMTFGLLRSWPQGGAGPRPLPYGRGF